MASGYDDWLATTPDDELAAAEARQARREAQAQRQVDRAELDFNESSRARWTPADFAYDPLSRRGFE